MPNTEFLNKISGERAGLAQHGLQAGVAGQRHGRELDGEIAQIERVADGHETDHQQKLDLIGRQPERSFFHLAYMIGNAGGDKRRGGVSGCERCKEAPATYCNQKIIANSFD